MAYVSELIIAYQQIAFGADKKYYAMARSVAATGLGQPLSAVRQRHQTSEIEDDHNNVRPTIVRSGDAFESLLSRRVPSAHKTKTTQR